MRASLKGREELVTRAQQALLLPTKKEAEHVVNTVVSCLECTILNNLGTNGFTMKLGSFGKFSVQHKPGILRKIPFTGKTVLTKGKRKIRFISLGTLRQREKVAGCRTFASSAVWNEANEIFSQVSPPPKTSEWYSLGITVLASAALSSSVLVLLTVAEGGKVDCHDCRTLVG